LLNGKIIPNPTNQEIKETAKLEDVKVLENYVNLWNPIQFVTRQEVEKLIKRALVEKEQERMQ